MARRKTGAGGWGRRDFSEEAERRKFDEKVEKQRRSVAPSREQGRRQMHFCETNPFSVEWP
jgi:hypothetical protein